jgi:hypothetical protein
LQRLVWLVILSAAAHIALFTWLLKVKLPIAPQPGDSLKTYIVSAAVQKSILEKLNAPKENTTQEFKQPNQAEPKVKRESKTAPAQEQITRPVTTSANHVSRSKLKPNKVTAAESNTPVAIKINPYKALNSMLSNEHHQFIEQQQVNSNPPQPKRITVPQTHQQHSAAIKLSDAGGKQVYQQGKNCYTIDLNSVMAKSDLPSGPPRPCKHIKSDDEILLEQSLNKWRKDKE